jgi:hypothetical protein
MNMGLILQVNTIQMTVMGAEAVGLCTVVCIYMYILLNHVNNYRWANSQS